MTDVLSVTREWWFLMSFRTCMSSAECKRWYFENVSWFLWPYNGF